MKATLQLTKRAIAFEEDIGELIDNFFEETGLVPEIVKIMKYNDDKRINVEGLVVKTNYILPV